MNTRTCNPKQPPRRGATLVLGAFFMVVLLGMVAFAVDLGYIVLARTQLQVAADSSAMAAAASMGMPREEMVTAAKQFAGYHSAGGGAVGLNSADVEYGIWDVERRAFTPSQELGNAIRVTTRTDDTTRRAPLFFGKIFGKTSFAQRASAVAMANPRDIVFVVDLSGSMNDDTEPCWATGEINKTFGPQGYPNIGNELTAKLYQDLGYGSYPGNVQYLAEPFGVPQDKYAYAKLTKDGGPLTDANVPDKYRINAWDNAQTRKVKSYSAIIDYQIKQIMPAATPTPDSSSNYTYWEKYLDYVIQPARISAWQPLLPPNQDRDRIDSFNNPNKTTFPDASSGVARGYRNQIGYLTYVQFMLDHGRDLKPDGKQYVPLSLHSANVRWHTEDTAGGQFRFPPRTQPVHAARRALIAAMEVVRDRNSGISDPDQADWVSVIVFDTLQGGGSVIEQPLTADYKQAMEACTRLQAVGDKRASTATEDGLITARNHIRSKEEGGQGRRSTIKVVVLLTDGVPNLYVSNPTTINQYISSSDSNDFYGNGAYRYDAPLMQAMQMQAENWLVFPVGVGLGTDYGFMDRLARSGGTADDNGQGSRGSGNPAEYEQRLTEIFENIITNPQVRLVQ